MSTHPTGSPAWSPLAVPIGTLLLVSFTREIDERRGFTVISSSEPGEIAWLQVHVANPS